MSNVKNEAKKFASIFLSNPLYIVFQAICIVIGYGYYLCNTALNVDTLRMKEYVDYEFCIQKRTTYAWIIKALLGEFVYPGVFSPITVLLLFISAFLFCFFLYCVNTDNIRQMPYYIIASVFCSYPLWSEMSVYTYLQMVTIFQVVLVLIDLIYILCNDHPNILINSVLLIAAGFGYEVIYPIYITLVVIVLFNLQISSKTDKHIPISIFIIPLVASLFFRTLINDIAFRASGKSAFGLDSMTINWFDHGVLYSFSRMLYNFYYYFIRAFEYFPIGIFLFASMAFAIIILHHAINLKMPMAIIYGLLIYLSLFSISFIQGQEMPYRVGAAGMAVFVSYTTYLLLDVFIAKKWRAIFEIILVYLCIMMALNTGKWLALNCQRSANEAAIARQIGYRLVSEYDQKKVVFAGSLDLGDYTKSATIADENSFGGKIEKWFRKKYSKKSGSEELYRFDGSINTSVINWARKTSDVGQRYMGRYLSYLGYDIICDEDIGWEELQMMTEKAEEMNMHPLEIKDMGEYILVYLGESDE